MLGKVSGMAGPGGTLAASAIVTGLASGAGPVNPPVLCKFDTDFMIPALPIWNTEEFVTPPIRI